MEHVFKIDLFPLLLLAYQYFLEMSQFGAHCSRMVGHDRSRGGQAVQSQDHNHIM